MPLVSWKAVLLLAIANAGLSWRAHTILGGDFDLLLPPLYATAAVAILVWRWNLNHAWLRTFGAALFSATLLRTVMFTFLLATRGERLSGIFLNSMVLLFVWRFTRSQSEWSV